MEKQQIETISSMMSSPDREMMTLGENLLVALSPSHEELAEVFIKIREKRTMSNIPSYENFNSKIYEKLSEEYPIFKI